MLNMDLAERISRSSLSLRAPSAIDTRNKMSIMTSQKLGLKPETFVKLGGKILKGSGRCHGGLKNVHGHGLTFPVQIKVKHHEFFDGCDLFLGNTPIGL